MLFRVQGESMLPTLSPGQLVLGWSRFRPRVGDVVVAQQNRRLVKRVRAIKGESLWLEGDNAGYSTDSRSFGYLPKSAVIAKIIG